MSDPVHRLVVGTDFSDTANTALRKAFDLASKEENSEVHVVNAVRHLGEYVQMDLPDTPAYRLPLDEAQDKIEAHVGGELSKWQAETGKTFSRCVTYLSTEFPAVGIAQLATDLDAEMIDSRAPSRAARDQGHPDIAVADRNGGSLAVGDSGNRHAEIGAVKHAELGIVVGGDREMIELCEHLSLP